MYMVLLSPKNFTVTHFTKVFKKEHDEQSFVLDLSLPVAYEYSDQVLD